MAIHDIATTIELSEAFFLKTALPALRQAFGEVSSRIAAGLVGNGSECMGFDDAASRDHDWSARFFLWLSEEDFAAFGEPLAAWREELFSLHPELPAAPKSELGGQPGVDTVSRFYQRLTGLPEGPKTMREWRCVPEENLALAVNGRVFQDGAGAFTAVRERLLAYYPEELRKKKIAARCMAIAQTGQYNFPRMAARGDATASALCLARFAENAMRLTFHLNRRFCPYYKWMFRGLGELPLLGGQLTPLLSRLFSTGGLAPKTVFMQRELIEETCALLAATLLTEGLSSSRSDFLADHGLSVQSRLTDPLLKALPAQYE